MLLRPVSYTHLDVYKRQGYVLADLPVAEQLTKLHSYTVVSAVSFLQPACEAAIESDPSAMIAAYRRRRDEMCNRMKKMGLHFPAPQGAFYCFPSISEFGLSSEEFCTRMIQEAKLAAVPGICFGVEDVYKRQLLCRLYPNRYPENICSLPPRH